MAAFVWGEGGAQMTPEAIAAQRKIAQAMMQRGSDYSPIQSAWQGAARLSEGLMGGLDARMADVAERKNATAEQALLASLITGGAPAAPPVAPAAAPVSAVAPSSPDQAVYPASAAAGPAPTTFRPGITAPTGGLSDAIAKVASAKGVDPAYLTRLAQVESGGNVNATNPTSSAGGPFQFINSTAKQYGLTNRFDPNESTDAAARLTLDNKSALTTSLGREPTPGELYLAHQQGAGGASKILANPNAPIEAVVGPEAARLNGAKPGMTAGQFATKWTGKFSDLTPAQPDGAVLPPNAQPAEGYAIPGQPSPAVAQVGQAMPQSSARLMAAMASPYVSDSTKKVLGIMLQSQLSNDVVQHIDLGNKVGIMDKRGNVLRTIDKGEPNKGPEWKETGEVNPQTGEKVMGWIDSRDKSVLPYQPKPAGPVQPSTIPPVPVGVDPKVWRQKQSERAAGEGMPASFDDTSKLRNEISQLPSYKNMAQAAPIYKSMADAAGRNTKAADLNMVYGLGKIMDPGSVVREGEIQMANNAQGWQEKLNGIIGQINNEGGLTPEGRQALMAEAHSRIQSYKMMYDQDSDRYRGIATRNRANPEDVVHNFGEFQPWTAPKAMAPRLKTYKIKAK
jgi:hypothetical protein